MATRLVLTSTEISFRYYRETLAPKSSPETDLEMIAIPADSFIMGTDEAQRLTTLPNLIQSGLSADHANQVLDTEAPHHRVVVSPFYLGRYPVTQAQWRSVMGNNPAEKASSEFVGDRKPVINVSWHDCVAFCEKLQTLTGRPYRLPSEAEWEYACRAGTTTAFHFGETITTELANYHGSFVYGAGRKGEYRGQTTEVGSFPANRFGLHDMHGNVWEWCADVWHENYQGAPEDGSAWLSGGDSDAHTNPPSIGSSSLDSSKATLKHSFVLTRVRPLHRHKRTLARVAEALPVVHPLVPTLSSPD